MGLFDERPGVEPKVIVDAQDHYYFAYDASHPIFRVDAELDRNTIVVTVQTKLPDGRRSKVLHAAKELRRALDHFDGRAERVLAFWTPELPDSLAELNALCVAHPSAPLEELATRTWSGRQLVAAGYPRVEIEAAVGERGAYRQVRAYFWR